jgi:hypothetical protein
MNCIPLSAVELVLQATLLHSSAIPAWWSNPKENID